MSGGRITTSVPFLNVPYGAYVHRDVPPVDEEITHVGPGTPCGEWLRRFWHPVFVSDELKYLPVAIRILGEDLVVFRDRSGQVGLLELHCSHRGTSLEFGQIEERGIRCCYHAWLYDVDGKLLETPGEPAESTLKDRLYHGAYPTHEYQGLVFAYMGPPDKRPAFPIFDAYDKPGYPHRVSTESVLPCNWLQAHENIMDPAHLLFLHTLPGNMGFSEDFARRPEWDFLETPLGMVSVDTRRRGERVWVLIIEFILPNLVAGPDLDLSIEQRAQGEPFGRPTLTKWWVPVDDTHTMRFSFTYGRIDEKRHEEGSFGQEAERPYEERQRLPGDYDAQVSQRPIAIHDLEHRATTDRGVIMVRNMIRWGVHAVRRGEDPQGVSRNEGEVVPTYSHDRVLLIPPASTPEEDRRLLRETGRRVAEEYAASASQR